MFNLGDWIKIKGGHVIAEIIAEVEGFWIILTLDKKKVYALQDAQIEPYRSAPCVMRDCEDYLARFAPKNKVKMEAH